MMLVDDIINKPITMRTGKQLWPQTLKSCLACFLHYFLLSFSDYYTAFISLVDLVCSSLLGIIGWLWFLHLPHSHFTLFWPGKVAWLSDSVGLLPGAPQPAPLWSRVSGLALVITSVCACQLCDNTADIVSNVSVCVWPFSVCASLYVRVTMYVLSLCV